MRHLGELRHEPIGKRIRGVVDGRPVVDTTRAVLVYEPRRVVPSYGVPAEDITGELSTGTAAAVAADDVGLQLPDVTNLPILDPRIPFRVHSADGDEVTLRAGDREVAGFRIDDPDLAGYVVLDFGGMDEWYEEDELNVSHPRDPFHRIDVLPSSRHVRLEVDGELLAESSRAQLLFETMLPVRCYLPTADVRVELRPSETHTWCAYKGQASYFSPVVGGHVVDDLAWTYPAPLHDADRVQGLVAFFDEHIDMTLDGERRPRPVTPWS